MKTGTWIAILYGLTLAATAFWLLLERSACAQIHEENTALRQRLNDAIEKLAENQRPDPNFISFDIGANDNVRSGEGDELSRLRKEADGLIQLHQQAEALKADTSQTQETLKNHKAQDRAFRRAAQGNTSRLQITKAEYWTDNKRIDVTGEIQDRIRGDSLKAVASNNINGDPEFGQVKHLTIEYSFDGVAKTNEFREGEVIVIPSE
jgi:hypothetical protein